MSNITLPAYIRFTIPFDINWPSVTMSLVEKEDFLAFSFFHAQFLFNYLS